MRTTGIKYTQHALRPSRNAPEWGSWSSGSQRSDRLGTLITFEMDFQNLCDQLEGFPFLQPNCHAQERLDWTLYKRQFAAVDLLTFANYMWTWVEAASDVTVMTDIRQVRLPVIAYWPLLHWNWISGPAAVHIFTDVSEKKHSLLSPISRQWKMARFSEQSVVMAKVKVAPLKSVSVHRLKPLGALLWARLAKSDKEFHTIPLTVVIFGHISMGSITTLKISSICSLLQWESNRSNRMEMGPYTT